ncbi:MAG TPA: hypothetical protein VNQ90_08740 [Chthoniobacteraceae bacterium]|nr:hypothetical protein [Chthoniobacteraceae bacterium]
MLHHFLRRSPGRSAAFTVTELLLAVVVVALLLALLIPAIGTVRARMRATQCLGQVRQMGIGALQFANEHNGKLPITDWNPAITDRWKQRWYMRLAPYIHPGRPSYYPLYRCPSVEARAPRTHNDPALLGANVDFVCLYAAPPTIPEGRPIFLQKLPNSAKVGLIIEGNGPSHGGPYSERTFHLLVDPALDRHDGWVHLVYCDGHAVRVHRPLWSTMYTE